MKWNPEKQCITNDDGSSIKPNAYTDRDGVVSFSIAARYPMYESWRHSHHRPFIGPRYNGYGPLDIDVPGCKSCEAEHKRGERWRAYLRKELGI